MHLVGVTIDICSERIRMRGCGHDLSGSGGKMLAGSCERGGGGEPTGSNECGEFLYKPKNY